MVPKIFNILFFIKKPKSPATGPYPIYLRITVDGNRKEFSVGRKCPPDKWNKNIERSTGTKEEFKGLNYYLDKLQQLAFDSKSGLATDQSDMDVAIWAEQLLDTEAWILNVFNKKSISKTQCPFILRCGNY